MMQEKIAVLMGGTSSEREISLQSGEAVMQALQKVSGINAVAIDVAHPFIESLQKGDFDKVFIALHGKGGEDGCMQGLLELLNLPYTGSGVMASALAMDKLRTKYVWQGCGIPTPDFALLNEQTNFAKIVDVLGLPLIVKPAKEGSSIGMTKVNSLSELQHAYQVAKEYDDCVIAEAWIDGEEYTISILKQKALPIIHLKVTQSFYDYQAKYERNDTQYLIPSGLDAEYELQLSALAVKAFESLGCSGWGRVDLMMDKNNQAWFLEANTVPGMTSHSLVPMAAKAAGIDFKQLVLEILSTAKLER